MNRSFPLILFLLAALGLLIGSASAGVYTPPPAPTEPTPPPGDDEGWRFGFRPYAWMTGVDGILGADGVTSDVDIDFGDILDNLDMVWSSTFEARRGRWGVFLDFTYLKLSDSFDPAFSPPPAPPVGPDGFEMEMYLLDLIGSYRAFAWEGGWLELTGGLRWLSVENTISLETVAGDSLSAGAKDDWLDPHVGLRLHQELGTRTYLRGMANVGGFGLGSDLTVQLLAAVGYRFNDHVAAELGYRYLKEDYENGDTFTFDAEMHGPILGLSITW